MEWNAFKNKKDVESKTELEVVTFAEPVEVGLGSSEKGNACPELKAKKSSRTSVQFKFFETAPDGRSRRCKFCTQSYSLATATGNLWRHLRHRHPGYDKLDGASQQAPEAPVSPKKIVPLAKSGTVDFDHLNWLLLKWFIGTSTPPAAFEDDGLVASLRFLNPSVVLWSSEKVHAVTLQVFRSMREDVKASLEHVSSKVSITLEFWTSHEQLFFMSIRCHWVDENWSPQSLLLDVCHVSYPCTGSEVFRSLMEVLKMYNLDKRVLSCTYDNSQQAVNACHALREELDACKAPFCYIPCAAHTLNQIIEDGLRSPKPILSKIREFALELNSHPEVAQDFQQLSTIYREGSWKFPIDTSATWSGHYAMLELVCKASNSMDSTIKKHEEAFGGRNLWLSSTEKSVIGILHSYLEPFHKITTNLSSSKVPTIGLVLFFMDHVFELIGTCKDACRQDWLKSIADDMARPARGFSSQGYNLFTYMAAVLDPRIKKELIPENLNSDKNLDEARSHFSTQYASTHVPTMPSGYSTHVEAEVNLLSFAEEIARKRRRLSMNAAASDELSQYLAEPPAPIATDVLEWWKVNSSRYPRLSVMARDYLAVQGTSVDPDVLFSSKGDGIHKQRFCLPHGSTRAVLCVDSWRRSGLRFKFRSAEVNYEKLIEGGVIPNS